MNIPIVHENANLLIINKPAGLLTHPTDLKDASKSVAGWVLEKYPEVKEVGEDPLRPGIVHRLDKETSGLMIIAKNQPAFDYLKKLFQERKIKKTYIALVHGKLKNETGIIDLSLGKIGTKQTTRIKGRKDLREREAVTKYEVINRFTNSKPATLPVLDPRLFAREFSNRHVAGLHSYTLLSAFPLTGRTHQIRVHLNSIGHPIVCDSLYGGRKKYCPPELGRLFLHAQKLEFTSPSGQRLHLEVEPPSELTNFLNSLTISQ